MDKLTMFVAGALMVAVAAEAVTMPDGRPFPFWDDATAYARTWHVSPAGDDGAAGDAAHPLKTIDAAAKRVRPGEKVVVHAGVYRETVESFPGGTDAAHMVAFEADGDVTVTGAEDWRGPFVPSQGYRQTEAGEKTPLFSLDDAAYLSTNRGAKVWMGRVPKELFVGINPFAVLNAAPLPWIPARNVLGQVAYEGDGLNQYACNPKGTREEGLAYLKKRGLMFCDGERMEQALYCFELWDEPVATVSKYWVADGGREIHFRLKGDVRPEGHRLELAVREQGFASPARGLAYVRLKGFRFEKFSNPVPAPQKGAISLHGGHHWIVEDCTVADVNTIGLDLGQGSHHAFSTDVRGHDVVRRCRFERCGLNGVCGVPANGRHLEEVLIEDCVFDGCHWQKLRLLYEGASVKTHYTRRCLYRRNIIVNQPIGSAFWVDNFNQFTRISDNVVIGCPRGVSGAIYLEASLLPCRVDRNFVAGARPCEDAIDSMNGRGHAVCGGGSDDVQVDRNVFYDCTGIATVGFHYADPPRVLQGGATAKFRGDRVLGNAFIDCGAAVAFPTKDCAADDNLYVRLKRPDAAYVIHRDGVTNSIEQVRSACGWERGARTDDKLAFELDGLTVRLNGAAYDLAQPAARERLRTALGLPRE